MLAHLRLLYFELSRGYPLALKLLLQELGCIKMVIVVLKLQYRQWLQNPFKELNRTAPPNASEKLSQRQMLPAVLLYKILQNHGYNSEGAKSIVAKVVHQVAFEFLKFNVPTIKHNDVYELPRANQEKILNAITAKFFNATGQTEINNDNTFSFFVSKCSFAAYSKILGVPELAPIFCASDKAYFDACQPDVSLTRTKTLAENNLPCDFVFRWKEQGSDD
ncbi:MAG: hypothetical protein CMH60_03840 [Myxococcales bacterium]|nr:hypothetical protein [Myxococcales bacterium]